SHIIFEQLWESVRRDAGPELARSLDCQFELSKLLQIGYAGFRELRIGQVVSAMQAQIASQISALADRVPAGCSAKLAIRTTGRPDLNCWSRVEFSEDGRSPISLERLLGWISWRNGFDV